LPTQSGDVLHPTQVKPMVPQCGVGALHAVQAPPEPQVASALVTHTPLLQQEPPGQVGAHVPPLQQPVLQGLEALQAVPHTPLVQAWPVGHCEDVLHGPQAPLTQPFPAGQSVADVQPHAPFGRQA